MRDHSAWAAGIREYVARHGAAWSAHVREFWLATADACEDAAFHEHGRCAVRPCLLHDKVKAADRAKAVRAYREWRDTQMRGEADR